MLSLVRQSSDAGSAATLTLAFVTSRVDYCNAALARSPRFTTDKLQRVMNSASPVVSNTQMFVAVCRGYGVTAPLALRHRPSTIQARRADVPVSSWNSPAEPGDQLYTNRRRCWSSASVLRSASQQKLIVPRIGVARIWCEEGHETKREKNLRTTHTNIVKFMQ